MAKVNVNSDVGPRRPRYVSTARASVTSTAYDCRTISNRRRSNRSASAPANNPKSSVGPRLAVWTSATMTSLLCFSTKNHWAATLCIHVPMLEANCAINRFRYTRLRNGAHADGCSRRHAPDPESPLDRLPGAGLLGRFATTSD